MTNKFIEIKEIDTKSNGQLITCKTAKETMSNVDDAHKQDMFLPVKAPNLRPGIQKSFTASGKKVSLSSTFLDPMSWSILCFILTKRNRKGSTQFVVRRREAG